MELGCLAQLLPLEKPSEGMVPPILRLLSSRFQRGGKPVIYVWTPGPQVISVGLSLVPQWEFSVLYPVAPIALVKLPEGTGQGITWNIQTRDDGTILDEATGLEVTYLFWEAL